MLKSLAQIMKIIADLHIHSYLSRACSPQLKPAPLHSWSQLKGVTVLATGDFTHPQWFNELRESLIPAEEGLFALRPDLARKADEIVPEKCRAPVRFVLGVEISCIYKKNGRVRKVHSLVFAPSFEVAAQINSRLDKIGNIKSDGRPILGLDCKDLLQLIKECSTEAHLIPAHAWTPHFSVFGSESGFDSLEECFEELTPHIFALETGLSSDPPMNWQISALDKLSLISNSDAHSPEKLAREANLLNTELSYRGIFGAFQKPDPKKFVKTLEFFPEEGKYHVDGHRNCKVRMLPQETIERQGLCRLCNKPVTVGVLHRVAKLADRVVPHKPPKAPNFENIIPLKEIIGDTLDVGPTSVKVDRVYHRLLALFGNELSILRELPLERLEEEGFAILSQAIERMRKGKVHIEPGYDGEYGVISVFVDKEPVSKDQLSLF